LKAISEVVCAVFKKDDEAKREEDKQSDPEYPAQQ
jgi:hypothetical protein